MLRVYLRLVLAAILCLCVARANAQATNGVVPDPITTQQLDLYAASLNLSPQQRIAVADMHLKYAGDYQTLREGAIARFLDPSRRLGQADAMRERDDIIQRIASLDGQFFDQVQLILSDEQAAAMPRVRAQRERDRLLTDNIMIPGLRPIDLSVLVRDLKFDSTELAAIDGALAKYEIGFTALLRDVARESGELRRKHIAAREAAGPYDADAPPEKAAARRELNEKLNAEFMAFTRDSLSRIRAFNRRHCGELRALLPTASSRRLRNAFFGREYNPNLLRGFDDSVFDPILRDKGLTDAQKQAVADLIDQYNATLDAEIEKRAAALDDLYRRYSILERAGQAKAREEFDRVMAESTEALMKVRTSAYVAIEGVAGKVEPINRAADDPTAGEISLWPTSMHTAVGVSFAVGDMFVPGPLESGSMRTVGEALRLEAAVIEAIQQRYSERFAQLEANEIENWRTALDRMKRGPPTSSSGVKNDEPVTVETAVAYIAARRAGLAAVDALDRLTFDEFRDAAGVQDDDPRLQRAIDARLRRRFNRGSYGGMWATGGPGQRSESAIDLSFLLRRRLPQAATVPAVEGALLEYERAVTPLFQRKFEATLTFDDWLQRDRVERMIAAAKAPKAPEPVDVFVHARKVAGAELRAVCEANDAIAAANQEAFDAIIAVLPVDAAFRLQRDYQRLSYPTIFRDPTWVSPALGSALAIDNLTAQQRAEIEQLAAEYNPAYDALCATMIASIDTADSYRYNRESGDTLEAYTMRADKRKRLAFEQHELNMRTINRLKAILSEEQIKSLANLPPPEDFTPRDFGW